MPQDHLILERNLQCIERTSPYAAARIREASAASVEFVKTDDGVLQAVLEGRGMGSRRHPLAEARRLADTVDPATTGGVVVLGFGIGHHVAELVRRFRHNGVVIVFEPDVALLRAVLSHVDITDWARQGSVLFCCDPNQYAELARQLEGYEGIVTLGTRILEHPPSRPRLGGVGQAFGEHFTDVLKSVRTQVMTTLVHAEVTMRNQIANLDRYATSPGIASYAGVATGRPAVVVSAGPSLTRNIDQLSRPGVRDRVVIVAVQTVLKTLLSHGIRPHFVCALDYHEISKRFYEGLTASDVEGVTLVCEAKAHPSIPETFPGRVLMPQDEVLDILLGEAMLRERGVLPRGATVAHLCYFLARYLGCDPAILMGQDLGFTDGQYYASGAAIHQVWRPELGTFRTLEMFEWERIARAKNLLRRASDIHGRPIFTDEQMSSYLTHFEKIFHEDTERGMRVIDATEGGLAKRHTTLMTLREAIEAFDLGTPLEMPESDGGLDAPRTLDRVDSIRAEVRSKARAFATSCSEVRTTLERMLDADQSRINSLIRKIDGVRTRLGDFEPAHELAHRLNQTGTLNRYKRDRAIELADLSPRDKQRAQIERDIENTQWLGDAATALGDMLEGRDVAIRTPADLIADQNAGPAAGPVADPVADLAESSEVRVESTANRRVGAVVMAHPSMGALGTARDLHHPFLAGRGLLAMTVERLRASGVDLVIVATPEPDLLDLEGVEVMKADVTPDRKIAAARRWAASTWRGGLGGATIHDEAFLPDVCLQACERYELDACVPVNADWALVDPQIVTSVVETHRADPAGTPLAFAHAPAGLGVCVIDRSVVRDLARRRGEIGWLATIGAMLGYVPIAPQSDPITRPNCVRLDASVRNVRTRFVADSVGSMQQLRQALAPLEGDVMNADASTIAALVGDRPSLPLDLRVELCTGRMTSGIMGALRLRGGDSVERRPMSDSLAHRVLSQAGRLGLPVTFNGTGDPFMHPGLADFILMARDLGVPGVHVRTDLICSTEVLESVLASEPDVVSVDLGGNSAATARTMLGVDQFDRVIANLEQVIEYGTSWVVPRLTRCDETMADIEGFYDHWLMRTGACMIDTLPVTLPGARIAPLPVPDGSPRDGLFVLCDGICPAHDRDVRGDHPIGDLSCETIEQIWRRVGRDERLAIPA